MLPGLLVPESLVFPLWFAWCQGQQSPSSPGTWPWLFTGLWSSRFPPFQDVEVSPKVEAVLSLLSAPGLSQKLVRPKALLDNCFRVLDLLYCSCCEEPWGRAGRGAGAGAQPSPGAERAPCWAALHSPGRQAFSGS